MFLGKWSHCRVLIPNEGRLSIRHFFCQTCVRSKLNTLLILENIAMDALVELIGDIKKAKQKGENDAELASARSYQRKAKFYLDFVEGREFDRISCSPKRPFVSSVSRLISPGSGRLHFGTEPWRPAKNRPKG